MPLVVNTSVRLYDDFIHLIFLHAHREATTLVHGLPEKSDQSPSAGQFFALLLFG
jgi:hypothetical protein